MVTPEMELDAAQALFAARLFEAALHHPGPWFFEWGGIRVPAEKTLTERGILFVGRFPDLCYLQRPEGSLTLICDDVVMGMRAPAEVEHPGDTGFEVSWKVLTRRSGADTTTK